MSKKPRLAPSGSEYEPRAQFARNLTPRRALAFERKMLTDQLCDEILFRCARIAESKRKGEPAKRRLTDAIAAQEAGKLLTLLYPPKSPKPRTTAERVRLEAAVEQARRRVGDEETRKLHRQILKREQKRTVERVIRVRAPMLKISGDDAHIDDGLVRVRVPKPKRAKFKPNALNYERNIWRKDPVYVDKRADDELFDALCQQVGL